VQELHVLKLKKSSKRTTEKSVAKYDSISLLIAQCDLISLLIAQCDLIKQSSEPGQDRERRSQLGDRQVWSNLGSTLKG
jgi:hypothetical protein